MTAIYASEQRFWGADDSETIQNAVNYAEETGFGQVIIPRFNDRTGKALWDLPRAVLLPSDMTIVLYNCHLRHADDIVFEHVTVRPDGTDVRPLFLADDCRRVSGTCEKAE